MAGNARLEDLVTLEVGDPISSYTQVITTDELDERFYIKKQTFAVEKNKRGLTEQQFKVQVTQNYPATATLDHRIQIAEIYDAVESNYNYAAKAYERFVENIDEKEIPNFYLSSDEIAESENLTDYRGFNSNLNETIFKGFGQDGKFRFNYKDESKITQFNNVLFGTDFDSVFFEEYKSVFPWVNKLEFTNPHSNDFYNLLAKVGVYEYLINDYLAGKKFEAPFSLTPRTAGGRPQVVSYEIFDMFEWSKSLPFVLQEEDKLIISKGFRSQSSYRRNFGKLVIAGRLRSLSYDKVRSIKQIHEGQLADHEICFYKVEKFIGAAAGQPVQSFWLPPNMDMMKYYDSQIKVDKMYTYSVKGYFLVYGTSYSHSITFPSTAQQQENSLFKASVEVTSQPSFQIVEVPLFQNETYVAQDPPMIPFVSFHNETDSKNNIEIFLNLAPGEKIEPLTIIEPEDEGQAENLSIMNSGGDPKFRFTSEPGLFEVYRLSSPPESYEDFVGFKLGEVRNTLDSSSILFREQVNSNTKYYYLFRAINSFGFKSNPTPIYEVELIRDADSSKVSVEVYEFPKIEEHQPTIKFQQLMQIVPAIQHTIVDESQPSIAGADSLRGKIEDILLGLPDTRLWGKTFKIRVSSTSSGKKIDLNLTFNVKKNKTTEDFG